MVTYEHINNLTVFIQPWHNMVYTVNFDLWSKLLQKQSVYSRTAGNSLVLVFDYESDKALFSSVIISWHCIRYLVHCVKNASKRRQSFFLVLRGLCRSHSTPGGFDISSVTKWSSLPRCANEVSNCLWRQHWSCGGSGKRIWSAFTYPYTQTRAQATVAHREHPWKEGALVLVYSQEESLC